LNEPLRSSERTIAEFGVATPASAARSRSRTPVHVWVVDQPSTHAIGSVTVCWGIASSAERSSTTGRGPTRRVSRHSAPVSFEVIAAADALRLTWKSVGPSP